MVRTFSPAQPQRGEEGLKTTFTTAVVYAAGFSPNPLHHESLESVEVGETEEGLGDSTGLTLGPLYIFTLLLSSVLVGVSDMFL